MFFHLQYIHLFRPFLKYIPSSSPLPSHVSPRRICTANAGAISKLVRLYKKAWNLRQICNIAVYMIHSACTIHLLNLPEKTARRDITHGVRHLEEIAEDWLCARRTLSILSMLAKKWNCEMPEDAAVVLQRTDEKYGSYSNSEVSSSPRSHNLASPALSEKVPNGRQPMDGVGMMNHPFGQSQIPQPSHNGHNGGHNGMHNGMSMVGQSHDGMHQGHGMMHNQPGPSLVDTSPRMDQSGTVEPMGCWNPQSQNLTTMSFPPMFSGMPPANNAPLPHSNHNAEGAIPAHNFRHGQNGSSNMDSPDWFLRDSVHWQQSFETWDMGANGNQNQNGQVFMFDDNRSTPSSGTRDMSQLDGINEPMGFEGLSASLNNGGWLTGLD